MDQTPFRRRMRRGERLAGDLPRRPGRKTLIRTYKKKKNYSILETRVVLVRDNCPGGFVRFRRRRTVRIIRRRNVWVRDRGRGSLNDRCSVWIGTKIEDGRTSDLVFSNTVPQRTHFMDDWLHWKTDACSNGGEGGTLKSVINWKRTPDRLRSPPIRTL